jgi:hypothetical protein
MRHQLATILLLATLSSTLAACDPSPKSIGSLDGETGDNTTGDGDGDGDGDGGLCGPSLVDLEFQVSPDGQQDVTLTCAAQVLPTPDGYVVGLTDCIDPLGMPAADVAVTLLGDWSEPPVHGEPQIELRYVQASVVINEEVTYQRWLSLRNPGGQFPLALIAVDSTFTYPAALGEFEFDYSPLAVDPVESDCPLIEGLACAPIQPGALVVSIDDQPFTIPEGHESMIAVGSDGYHVVVEETHSLVDDCPDQPGDEYVFGIVAVPNS